MMHAPHRPAWHFPRRDAMGRAAVVVAPPHSTGDNACTPSPFALVVSPCARALARAVWTDQDFAVSGKASVMVPHGLSAPSEMQSAVRQGFMEAQAMP